MKRVMATCLTLGSVILASACGEPAAPPNPAPAPPPAPSVKLYVSDETGGNIVVIDPEAGTVVTKIAVGKRPRGLRLSPDGS